MKDTVIIRRQNVKFMSVNVIVFLTTTLDLIVDNVINILLCKEGVDAVHDFSTHWRAVISTDAFLLIRTQGAIIRCVSLMQ